MFFVIVMFVMANFMLMCKQDTKTPRELGNVFWTLQFQISIAGCIANVSTSFGRNLMVQAGNGCLMFDVFNKVCFDVLDTSTECFANVHFEMKAQSALKTIFIITRTTMNSQETFYLSD